MVLIQVRTPFRPPQPAWVAAPPSAGSAVGDGGPFFFDVRSAALTHGAHITEANTGPRTSLSTVTGDVSLETDGETYAGKRVEDNLLIRANDVTVTDCSFSHGARIFDEYTGTRLRWCAFGYNTDGSRPTSKKLGPGSADVGVGYGNYEAYRCRWPGSATASGPATSRSWSATPGCSTSQATTATWCRTSAAWTWCCLRRCNFDARAYNDGDYSNAVLMSGDTSHGLTIVEECLLVGGGF